MRGIIVKWNDEKGYGFIRIDGGKKEVFCHISDFSQRMPRPEVNEPVAFEIASDSKGKVSAKQIRYLNRKVEPLNHAASSESEYRHGKRMSSSTTGGMASVVTTLIGLVIFAAIGYQVYQVVSAKLTPKQENLPIKFKSGDSSVSNAAKNNKFRCDGRQHCSQMTSCEEAKWFLRNCADTKMDGDGDGIPCEDRCSGW